MNKKLKIILFGLGIVTILSFSAYQYVMNAGGRDLATEEVSFKLKSSELKKEFDSNVEIASKKYTEKAIEISGMVTDVKDNQIVMDEIIVCQCTNKPLIKVGETIKIKGRFVGFDDLMGELKVDQCSIN